jgi:hypothetical protein
MSCLLRFVVNACAVLAGAAAARLCALAAGDDTPYLRAVGAGRFQVSGKMRKPVLSCNFLIAHRKMQGDSVS